MLPPAEQTEAAPPRDAVDELLTGDIGLVVVRALLENGVGYVVSSWRDRPTPIDAAIDEARERVLAPAGVVLRRLRSMAALEPIIAAPSGGITGAPPRGAVVFAGRNGLRPGLEQFLRVDASGAVVGFCFDEEALRIEDALVVDPEPTAAGVMRAIDEAYQASLRRGRPALVVLRERALGMRGTIRRRPQLSPVDAASSDAAHRKQHGLVSTEDAVAQSGLGTAVHGSAGTAPATGHVLFVEGPLYQATERALAEVAARAPAARRQLDAMSIVASRAVGVLLPAHGMPGRLLADASKVLVLAARADRVASRLRASGLDAAVEAIRADPGHLRGEELVRAIAGWALEHVADDEAAGSQLRAITDEASRPAWLDDQVAGRLPRRSEALVRAVSPGVSAALALAQGVLGVPARVHAAYPTYRTDSGVPLTVVPAAVFAVHGVASAAPGSGPGVFVVSGSAAGVPDAASAAGASIEFVDSCSPRALGASIARACRSPRATPHVVVAAEVQRVAAPRRATFGMDPDLVGTERLAVSAVPAQATALVDLGDELLSGPSVIALDRPDAHAALDPLRELSPATWDLRRAAPGGAPARAGWKLRRRILRAAAGVDL